MIYFIIDRIDKYDKIYPQAFVFQIITQVVAVILLPVIILMSNDSTLYVILI